MTNAIWPRRAPDGVQDRSLSSGLLLTELTSPSGPRTAVAATPLAWLRLPFLKSRRGSFLTVKLLGVRGCTHPDGRVYTEAGDG